MFLEYFKLSLEELKDNKLRTFLSLIGIVIGVAVVYIVLSIADIAEVAITSEILDDGGIITVQYTDDVSGSMNNFRMAPGMKGNFAQGTELSYDFQEEDVTEIDEIAGVLMAYANYNTSADVIFEDNDKSGAVKRTTDVFQEFFEYNIVAGKDLSEYIGQELLSLALIDTDFLERNSELEAEQVIGSMIYLNNRIYKIAGVYETSNNSIMNTILLNEVAYDSMFSQGTIENLSIKIDPLYDVDIVGEEVTEFLNAKYGTEENYEVQDLSSMLESITSVTNILSIVMAVIGGISLLVAGIGVMNIMYVSVIERTREIGVKRALGASKGAIMIQFIVEAALLTLIGGLLGILIGVIVINVALSVLELSMPTNYFYISFAIAFSITLGIVFGFLPAKQAANLNIIAAIATE